MKLILLLILKLSAVCSESHSLKYYITGVSSPGSGLPVYSVVGYLDDREIENYNSDTRQYLPKTEWMKQLDPDYWARGTALNQKQEPIFKQNVQIAMSRFNQTEGFHIFQSMHGCMLDDDGTVLGYEQIGYDGRDFMYLDTQNGIWIPAMYAAEITTQRWNSPEESQGNKNKNYLENECIETLKKLIQLWRNDMSTVPPMMKVSAGHTLSDVTKLHCQVYGFYPQAVTVRWIKNGIDTINENQANHILPNPDGTYQTTLSIEVQVREVDTYSCHVDHSSLQETVIILWGYKAHKDQISHGDSNPNIGLIVGLLAAAFIIVLGLIIWKRRSVFRFVQQAAGHCSILPSFLQPSEPVRGPASNTSCQ